MADNYYFRLRDKLATKPTPIILIAQINGQRIKCKTQLTILPTEWDHVTGLPSEPKKNSKYIRRLTTLKSLAIDTYYYFRDTLKISQPDTKEFQTKFYEYSGIDVPTKTKSTVTTTTYNFFEFLDKFIDDAHKRTNEKTEKPLSRITICNFKQLRNRLTKFSKEVRRVDFDTIDQDFYEMFLDKMYRWGYSTNTAGRYIKLLKTVLNAATEGKYNTNLAYKSKKFKARSIDTPELYLTEDEITELHNLDLSGSPRLERVRDLFLVGCYTGLRYSDFTNIQPENINGNIINLVMQKTGNGVAVPIHTKLFEIMQRYEGKTPNSLPPAMSNQKLNLYIKEVCSQVPALHNLFTKTIHRGLFITTVNVKKYKEVSSHTARRSFATNQHRNKVPASILMKITGHKTESAFYRYIRETPKENAERLLQLWQQSETSHLKVV